MTAGNGKPCKKCGTSEWGPKGNCRQCTRDRAAKKYREDPAAAKEYAKRNRERIADRARRWRENNRAAIQEYNQRWYRANAEANKEQSRQWQRTHPEQMREYRRAAKHRRKAAIKGSSGSYTAAEWAALVKHYGGRCLCCGRNDVTLTVDHIVPLVMGGSNDISNIQPLCRSCNCSKQAKNIDYRPDKGIKRWIQRKLFG